MENENTFLSEEEAEKFEEGPVRKAIIMINTDKRDQAVVDTFEQLLSAASRRDIYEEMYLDCRLNAKLEAKRVQREYGYAMDELRRIHEDHSVSPRWKNDRYHVDN